MWPILLTAFLNGAEDMHLQKYDNFMLQLSAHFWRPLLSRRPNATDNKTGWLAGRCECLPIWPNATKQPNIIFVSRSPDEAAKLKLELKWRVWSPVAGWLANLHNCRAGCEQANFGAQFEGVNEEKCAQYNALSYLFSELA